MVIYFLFFENEGMTTFLPLHFEFNGYQTTVSKNPI